MVLVLQKKYRGWLLVLPVVLSACQPQSPTDARDIDDGAPKQAHIVVNKDSVSMAQEDILSIKSSRYQPSLGLQGTLAPIQETTYRALKDATVTEIFVEPDQWVDKNTPLLMLSSISTQTTSETAQDASTENLNAHKIPRSNAQQTSPTQEEAAENHSTLAENMTTAKDTEKVDTLLMRARFAGRVDALYVQEGAHVQIKDNLLHLADDRNLQFTAAVPLQAKSQLSVGQTVNFTTDSLNERFTGQVSALLASNTPNQLRVEVHVLEQVGETSPLRPDMTVTGRVNYGQIEVGTIVPERGIHDADLSALKSPPYQPLSPLTANVWVIKQDQRLTRQPVEVIEYDPNTKQYLVAGISNDSLICLANLPIESAGKKVVIS